MRARIVTAAAAVVSVAGVLAPLPVLAETAPPGGGAYIGEDGDPTVEAGDGAGGGNGSGGSEVAPGAEPCTWQVVIEDDSVETVYDPGGAVQYSQTGRWLRKFCPGIGPVAVNGLFLIPEGGVVDVEQLALQARSSVSIPSPKIGTSPDVGRLVVRIPTWLWVDGSWWHGYQATATAGRVVASVTATPRSTTWQLGDGSTVQCDGPGTPWVPGLSEADATCAHTYSSSSEGRPGGAFTITASVDFDITWTSNIGRGGTLPVINRTSSQTVEVGEILAVGTGS